MIIHFRFKGAWVPLQRTKEILCLDQEIEFGSLPSHQWDAIKVKENKDDNSKEVPNTGKNHNILAVKKPQTTNNPKTYSNAELFSWDSGPKKLSATGYSLALYVHSLYIRCMKALNIGA